MLMQVQRYPVKRAEFFFEVDIVWVGSCISGELNFLEVAQAGVKSFSKHGLDVNNSVSLES